MSKTEAKRLEYGASMLRAIADPVRLEILNVWKDQKTMSVGAIQKKLDITQSMTSQHLAALKNVNIVNSSKDANTCNYYLENKNILKLLACVKNCACADIS